MSQSATEDVVAEIRAELGRQDRTKAWLAAQLGVSEMWVSRRLRSETKLTVEDLHGIAKALGVPASQFVPEVAAR